MYTRCSNGTGRNASFPYWNHDRPGISHPKSVVWYFQELAAPHRPGTDAGNIDKIGYGNKDISGGLTTFWLGSSLQISALEQVDLLNKLYSGQLPFSAANTRFCKRTSLFPDGTKLMGKTGSRSVTKKWVSGVVRRLCQQGRPVLCLRHEHRSRGRRQRRQSPGDNEIHPEGNGYFVTALAKRHIRNKTGEPAERKRLPVLALKDIMVAPARATSRQVNGTHFSPRTISYIDDNKGGISVAKPHCYPAKTGYGCPPRPVRLRRTVPESS